MCGKLFQAQRFFNVLINIGKNTVHLCIGINLSFRICNVILLKPFVQEHHQFQKSRLLQNVGSVSCCVCELVYVVQEIFLFLQGKGDLMVGTQGTILKTRI